MIQIDGKTIDLFRQSYKFPDSTNGPYQSKLKGDWVWYTTGNGIEGSCINSPTRYASYQLVDAWNSYSTNQSRTVSVVVRAKPQSHGASQWIKYRATMSKDESESYFINSFSSGEKDQQGWYVKNISVNITAPSPSVSADCSSITLVVGETKDIKFTLSNSGCVADRSYLDVILSEDDGLQVTGIVSYSSNWWYSGYPKIHPDGTVIWKKTDTDNTGATLSKHPAAVEAYRNGDWSSGSSAYITLRIKGKSEGRYYIYYRGSMNPKGISESNYAPDRFIRDPTSGYVEPLTGWYAEKITVDVTSPDNPPNTSITSPEPTGTITTNNVTFTWAGNDDKTPVSNLLYSYYLEGYDSTWSDWTSATSKTYSNLSNKSYTFRVKTKDNSGQEDTSPAYRSFTVNYPPPTQQPTPSINNPPNPPSKPSGHTDGIVGQSHTFNTSATDPNDDKIQYGWDWGDGTSIEWSSLVNSGSTGTCSHSYSSPGSYTIKVKAKDEHGMESNWSDYINMQVEGILYRPPFAEEYTRKIQVFTGIGAKEPIYRVNLNKDIGLVELAAICEPKVIGGVISIPWGMFYDKWKCNNTSTYEITIHFKVYGEIETKIQGLPIISDLIGIKIPYSEGVGGRLILKGNIYDPNLKKILFEKTEVIKEVAKITSLKDTIGFPSSSKRELVREDDIALKIKVDLEADKEYQWEAIGMLTLEAVSGLGLGAYIEANFSNSVIENGCIQPKADYGITVREVLIKDMKPTITESRKDTVGPDAPIITSFSHPDENDWYQDNNPSFAWSIPLDNSGISEYCYKLNRIKDYMPNPDSDDRIKYDASGITKSYSNLDEGTLFFHVRARDCSGNWGDVGHYQINIKKKEIFNKGAIVGKTGQLISSANIFLLGEVSKEAKSISKTISVSGTETADTVFLCSSTDSEGNFEIEVPEGKYSLWVISNGTVLYEKRKISVNENQITKVAFVTDEPQKIICQYIQSQEKITLKNYVDGELKEEIAGGELKVFSVDKGLIFEKKYNNDEVVGWDVSNISEGKYNIIFRTNSGKKLKTKFILDRGLK